MPASTAETSISAPSPVSVAVADRHQQGGGVEEGGLVVHVRQAPAGRLAAGQAADVRQPADRLDDRAVAAVLRVRAGVAVAAHPGVDHVRPQLPQPLVGQAPALHDAGREVLGDHRAGGDQPVGEPPPFGGAHVDRHAELVAAVVVEQAALVRVGVGVFLAVVPRASPL